MNDTATPQLSLGLLFSSATKQEMYKPLITMDVPPYVRAAIQKVCEQVVSTGAEAAGAVGEVVVDTAGSVKETVKEETPRALKTLGAVMMLRPQDIPADYQGPIYQLLLSKARNAPDDGLPNVPGADEYSVPGFITKPVAGWLGFEGDLGAVFWIDENNKLVGAAGTIKWALPVKSGG